MKKSKTIEGLALYHYQACPFCAMVRRAIDQAGLQIEQRDTQRQPQHRADLIKHGGKPQVPCLRIEKANGQVQWMYESMDIVDYLRKYAAKSA